ncbi:hypothetical protein AVEN_200819-1 [Araneus ventricosus]|uniref:Uncharacterized protein n=1 Tax=Araneus ventricosus TaxID=182803 RepID=A0A4Y2CH74_ARAVE|nr:hypothetical protein AVEN_200819-1 [Araneus ventricosus]
MSTICHCWDGPTFSKLQHQTRRRIFNVDEFHAYQHHVHDVSLLEWNYQPHIHDVPLLGWIYLLQASTPIFGRDGFHSYQFHVHDVPLFG